MINQSTNSIAELLKLLTNNSSGYYIEQKSISSFKEIDGHTVYSKFKYYNKAITQILINQHLSKDINIAVALKNYDAIVYDYSGKHREAFISLLKYFFMQEGINNLYITTLNNQKIILYVRVNLKNREAFISLNKKIEKKLLDRLAKEWRVLPNFLRPDIGNLLQLPREYIKL